MSQGEFPLSWNKALLTIIPGVLAAVGMIHGAICQVWLRSGFVLRNNG